MFNIPIAYIIFNRPRHTRKTFATIRARRPTKIFIIADGPRLEHPTDTERCREVRKIVENIDWPCEVYRNYANQNLGLKQRVSSGLDWVFRKVEKAIVLEDDCLPHPDFFTFCKLLLDHYETDERVWVITGNNFQDGCKRGEAAYYFSKYTHCWGWATWRKAWQHYQDNFSFWSEWKNSADWHRKTPDQVERKYWSNIFGMVNRGEINSWAYPWMANVWYYGGLTATPNVNLVTNIGLGPDGTHTIANKDQEGLPAFSIGPLTHPKEIAQDLKADRYVFDHTFGGINQRLHRRLQRLPRRVLGKFSRIIKVGLDELL
ncbi:glycosyltransferase family 2 protein [Thermodesulfobacteriota bacterium]